MTRFYRRRPPSREETAAAVLLATGVGAVTFYFTRLLLARDPVVTSRPAATSSNAPVLEEPARGDASLPPGAGVG